MVRRRGDDLGKVPREGLHFTVHESKWKFIHSYKGFFAIHVLEFIVSKTKSCWIYFYRLCLLSNYTRRPSCFSFSLFLFFLFCIRSFGLVMKRTGEETSTVSSPHTWPGLPYTVAWWKIFSQSGAMAALIQKKPFVDTQGDCAGRQSRSWEQQMVQTQRGPLLGQLDQPENSFVDALHQM